MGAQAGGARDPRAAQLARPRASLGAVRPVAVSAPIERDSRWMVLRCRPSRRRSRRCSGTSPSCAWRHLSSRLRWLYICPWQPRTCVSHLDCESRETIAISARRDLTAGECGRVRRGAGRRRRRGGCWRSRWCWKASTGRARRRPAGWIGRRCGTGYTATMRRGSPGSRTAGAKPTAAARPEPCGRTCVMAGGRPRPGGGRGGALAAAGPSRPDRGPVRGRVARADGGQVSRGARLPAAVGAPAASEDRPCGPGTL